MSGADPGLGFRTRRLAWLRLVFVPARGFVVGAVTLGYSQDPDPDPVHGSVESGDGGPAEFPRSWLGVGARGAGGVGVEGAALRGGVPLRDAGRFHGITDPAVGAGAPEAPDAIRGRIHASTTTGRGDLV